MAQDFGDDIGEMLFTGFKRSLERAIYDFWRDSRNNNRDEEWYGESTGQSGSASKNLQIQGRDLIDAAEIGKMSRRKAILLIAGTNPLMDDKFDPHTHKRYCYIVDKRNPKRLHDKPFDFKRYLEGGCEPYDDHDDGDTGEKR